MKKSLRMLGAAVLGSFVLVGGAFAQVSPALPEPGWAPDGSPVAKHGALTTGSGKIVDKNNQAVTLRGMSLYWAGYGEIGGGDPYYNDAVIGGLAHDFKVSVVRAAIPAAKQENIGQSGEWNGANPGYADGGSTLMLRLTRTVVEACIRRGVYVLIDWHTHNKASSNYSSKGAEFMGLMAKEYGKYPNVLFEPFNEPMDGNEAAKTYMAPIITEIRKNSNNIIVVGSTGWSSQPDQISVSGTNIAYSSHFYANTHPSSGPYATAITNAINAGKAVFVTEFGTTSADGAGTVNTSESDKWINFLEGKSVGWINWSVEHGYGASAAFSSNAAGGPPWTTSQSGTWARSKIRQYNATTYYPSEKYAVNVTATPAEGGTVEKKVGNSVNNGPYNWKDAVTITATPKTGWEVQKWTGDAYGTATSLSVTVYAMNYNMGVVFYNGGVIKNGHFDQATTNWSVGKDGFLNPSPSATMAWDGSDANKPQMKVTITAAGTNPEDLYVYQSGLTLTQGRQYELSFEAKAASSRKLIARVSNNRAASATPYLKYEANLGTTLSQFKTTFNMGAASVTNGRLDFDIGGNTAAVSITNVKLLDVGQGTGVARGAVSKPAAYSWSVANVGGVPQLRGPAEAGAKAALYDTRGKLVKSMSAVNGLTIGGAGIPAGHYLLVVKNASGAEMLRSKVMVAR